MTGMKWSKVLCTIVFFAWPAYPWPINLKAREKEKAEFHLWEHVLSAAY